MKKVLILGASSLQLPMIKKARDIGYRAIVVDYDENAVGKKYADKFYLVSTNDYDGVSEVAIKEQIDGITTIATDFPMRVIGRICDRLSLNGISEEAAINSTDKGAMIRRFEKEDVPHPWYRVYTEGDSFGELEKGLEFPCICKPVDNSGSRGVRLVSSVDELKEAIDYSLSNARGNQVIIEEFLEGNEISVEIFVAGNDIHVIAVTDKITTGAPGFVEMGHTQPSQYVTSEAMYNSIVSVARKGVEALGILSGPAHVEMMVTEKGPKIIEIGARLGGDYITSDLTPLSTGVDMIEATLRAACSDDIDLRRKFEHFSGVRYLNPSRGRITSIVGVENARKVPGIRRVEILKALGDCIGNINSSVDRVGYVIASGKTREEVVGACEHAMREIKIEVN